jgi:hypothetical protein
MVDAPDFKVNILISAMQDIIYCPIYKYIMYCNCWTAITFCPKGCLVEKFIVGQYPIKLKWVHPTFYLKVHVERKQQMNGPILISHCILSVII